MVCGTDSDKTDSSLTLLYDRLLLTNFCPCYILSGWSHSFPENVPQQQRVRQQRSMYNSYGLPSSMPHGEHSSKDSWYMCQVCSFNYTLIILPYISSSRVEHIQMCSPCGRLEDRTFHMFVVTKCYSHILRVHCPKMSQSRTCLLSADVTITFLCDKHNLFPKQTLICCF